MSGVHEAPFRITFGILWLLYLGVRVHFHGRMKGKREYVLVNERQEILFFRLFAAAFLLVGLYVVTSWLDRAHLPCPAWLRSLGAAVTCAGLALFAWAHQALGPNWTAVLALAPEQELITRGPYRYVRHPMYSAFFVIGLGFLLLSANWLVGALYLGTFSLMYGVRVSAEEEMMIGRFGDAYRQYMQRTGRLLPWPRK